MLARRERRKSQSQSKLLYLVELAGQAPYNIYGFVVALLLASLFVITVGYAHLYYRGALFSLPFWVAIAECSLMVLMMLYYSICFSSWLGLDKFRQKEIIRSNASDNRIHRNNVLFHLAATIGVFYFFGLSVLAAREILPDILVVGKDNASENAVMLYVLNMTTFGYGYEIARIAGYPLVEAEPNNTHYLFALYCKVYSWYFASVILKVIVGYCWRTLRSFLGE